MHRRTLMRWLGGSAVALALPGCHAADPPGPELAARLGLSPAERAWLAALTPDEREELSRLLAGGGSDTARAVELAAKVLSPRSRLFAYVGYPRLADERTVCDGVIRE